MSTVGLVEPVGQCLLIVSFFLKRLRLFAVLSSISINRAYILCV